MGFEDRLDALSDALYHIKELMENLKGLGCKYINTVDVLDDIRRQLDIDESITEGKLNDYWQTEQRALIKEYYQSR